MAAETDYDTARLRHIADRARIAGRLAERMAWPRNRLAAVQRDSLKSLLAHARDRSPWHRHRLRGIDIDSLTVEDIACIPPMTKADLMENWDGIVTRPDMTLAAAEDHIALVASDGRPRYFDGDCHVVTSSGTSGRRGVFVFDWEGWATYSASTTRAHEAILLDMARELGRRPRTCVIAAATPTHATAANQMCFTPPGSDRQGGILSSTAPLSEIVAALNACRPEVLVCYGSLVAPLTAEAGAGHLDIPLRLLIATAERVTPEVADAAGAQWSLDAPLLNPWASVETAGTWPCLSGEGSHLADDLNLFELIDGRGLPTPDGDPSDRILVTVLYNRLLPLIRYEIADSFRLLPGPCGCGVAAPRVEVVGRTEGFTYGSVKVHPALFMVRLLEDRRIAAYQVRQTPRGADIDIVAEDLGPDGLDALSSLLRQDLEAIGVAAAMVRITPVTAIPVSPSGKSPSFVPLPG